VYVLAGLALWVSACTNADAEAGIPTVPAPSTSTTSPSPASPTLSPFTPTDPSRLPASEAAAIDALAAVASPLFPPGGQAHGHGATGAVDSHALTSAQQSEFDRQWQAAVAAVPALDTVEEAAAAGYTQASLTAPGVGVHWVKWSLIDRPFDPAAPSMLLFDTRPDPPALAGFSYWLRADREPAGFAGANDTTRLITQAPLQIGDKTIAPGVYNVFVDLKAGQWTLVLNTQPVQPKFDPEDKVRLSGATNYDSKFDVLRVPMTVGSRADSLEQFTIAFANVTTSAARLIMSWERTVAAVDVRLAGAK
jgi:hypothetical protein